MAIRNNCPVVLVTGGSKSGKSAAAEGILSRFCGRKIYIAAMEPYGEDAARAIERHHRMRAGKGFETIERRRDLGGADIGTGSAVMIECMLTLLANEMFGDEPPADPVSHIVSGIESLSERASLIVTVSGIVSCDGITYPKETMDYMAKMEQLNGRLGEMADCIIESVCGIPVTVKGSLDDVLERIDTKRLSDH